MNETLVAHLATYRAYHRDRRNVLTHALGIPMIVLAVEILLSRPGLELGGVAYAPVYFALMAVCIFYFSLDRPFGLGMALLLGSGAIVGLEVAAQSTPVWLGWGLGLFIAGWALQILGHVWEGRKPAFLDNLIGLLIGPLYMLAEAVFALGGRKDLRRAIAARLANQPED